MGCVVGTGITDGRVVGMGIVVGGKVGGGKDGCVVGASGIVWGACWTGAIKLDGGSGVEG